MTNDTHAAHTPGPWAVENSPESYEIVSYSESMSATVAILTARHSETGHADAKLIAAAPDLLAALRDIATIATSTVNDEAWLTMRQHIGEAARAAIRTATGAE